jgi:peptidoglycan/LPS O-acetylase OafA/YrhL
MDHQVFGPELRSFRYLTVSALVVVVGFGSAIVLLPDAPQTLHELAGLILLLILAGTLWRARQLHALQPRLWGWNLAALGLLVVTGAVGGALALGGVPGWAQSLLAALLAVLAIILVIMYRIASGPPSPPVGNRGSN